MIPVQRVQAQAQVWPGEPPPPLLWMLPGLCPLASAAPPPPVLVASRAPPLLRAVSRWQLSSNSCEPFLPLVRAAEPVVAPFPLASVQVSVETLPSKHSARLPYLHMLEYLHRCKIKTFAYVQFV